MKTALIVFAVLIGLALASTPEFTVCEDKNSALQNAKVTSSDDWSGGSTVHFTIKGELSKPIDAGATSSTLAYFNDMEVENKSENLCTYQGTPFKCPEAVGEHEWKFSMEIPKVPFSGTLKSHTDFKNADGSSILCLDLKVDL